VAEGEGVLFPIEARDELSGALKSMADQAEKFMASMAKVNDTLEKTGNQADRAEGKVGTFMSGLLKIKGVGDAINGLKVKDLLHGFENMSVAGIAVGASMVKGTKDAMDMEHTLTKVGLSSKVTAEELRNLKSVSFELASASTITSNQIATVGGRLLKDGKSIEESKEIMASMTKLVGAFGGDYVESFKEISGVTKAFGQDLKTIPETLDLIAKVSSETNTDYTELLGALQSTAPFAKGVGLSMQELVNIYGSFKSAGLSSDQAIRAIRTSMMAATRANVSYKDALSVVGKAYQSTSNETARATLLQQTFGRMGLTLAPVFQKMGGDYQAMATKFKDSSGSLDRAAEAMDANAKDRMEALHNRLVTAQQEVADKYLPAVSTTTKLLNKIPSIVLAGGVALGQAAGVAFKLVTTTVALVTAWPKVVALWGTASAMLSGMAASATAMAASFLSVSATVLTWVALPAVVGVIAYKTTQWLMTLEKSSKVVHAIFETMREIMLLNTAERIMDFENDRQTRKARATISGADISTLHNAGMSWPVISAMTRAVTAPTVSISQRESIKELVREIGQGGVHIENAKFDLSGIKDAKGFEEALKAELLRGRKTTPSASPGLKTAR
jgi:hypothetical protein